MEPSQDHPVLGSCLSDADLLCASSGELPPDEWPMVLQHLALCPACAAKARHQLRVLRLCAVLEDARPAPDLQARRERLRDLMDAARADRAAGSPQRWLAVAAAVIALVAGLTLFPDDPLAHADEVVARAMHRERTLSLTADHWRFYVIPSGHDASPTWQDDATMPAQVTRLLETHGFDPDHPLSVARLQAWRAAQPERLERVTREDRWLVVQSGIERGTLRQVELVIDKTSFQVVKQTWLFAGVGRVVCERIGVAPPPRDRASAASRPGAGR